MDITDVYPYLPQRPPFLMIDRVTDVEPEASGVGHRHYQDGDDCFRGHFPGEPILPGVLITESFAQTAMVVMRAGQAPAAEGESKLGFLAKIDKMSFHRVVRPGDTIRFRVEVKRKVQSFFMLDCIAHAADDELVARGALTLSMAAE